MSRTKRKPRKRKRKRRPRKNNKAAEPAKPTAVEVDQLNEYRKRYEDNGALPLEVKKMLDQEAQTKAVSALLGEGKKRKRKKRAPRIFVEEDGRKYIKVNKK